MSPGEDTCVIKVDNVHHDATPELLRSFFEFHGQILRTQIKGKPDMRCGFIEFSDSSAAKSALLFDRSSFVGQQISVELCDEPLAEEEGGGAASESSEDFEKVEMQDAPAPAALEAEATAMAEARKPPQSPAKLAAANTPDKSSLAAKKAGRPVSPGARLDQLVGLVAPPVAAAAAKPPLPSLLSLAELPSFGCFRKVLREPINDVRAVLGLTIVGLAALALY